MKADREKPFAFCEGDDVALQAEPSFLQLSPESSCGRHHAHGIPRHGRVANRVIDQIRSEQRGIHGAEPLPLVTLSHSLSVALCLQSDRLASAIVEILLKLIAPLACDRNLVFVLLARFAELLATDIRLRFCDLL
mmetsp:Transcript_14350/g.44569  ORF Transcript_14350/g.44569 Transcript_14350/m.44569 type:complete len:135 (-) Transcript_14350:319-723(-)